MTGALSRLRVMARRLAENMLERPPAERTYYRGVVPASAEDPRPALPKHRPNSMLGAEWWSDNPLIAQSYGPFVRAARLARTPDVLLDAQGQDWLGYFLTPGLRRELRAGAFREAFADPARRDILVQAIQDLGPYSWPRDSALAREFEDLAGVPATQGSNLFVKPGSEIIKPRPPQLKARGGLAQVKECACA